MQKVQYVIKTKYFKGISADKTQCGKISVQISKVAKKVMRSFSQDDVSVKFIQISHGSCTFLCKLSVACAIACQQDTSGPAYLI